VSGLACEELSGSSSQFYQVRAVPAGESRQFGDHARFPEHLDVRGDRRRGLSVALVRELRGDIVGQLRDACWRHLVCFGQPIRIC
jgi:hypothetical protein